ncbi:uncharacterized protein BP5553_05674 [Venustampulla echinocandica]|uniref:DUF7735 domain-containing protein n=1 Tax=Venustampulla echinocandica TaxID=2656787 RepID=A0A370TLB4_9HELO|nr:uncharacterized protein BP5553_05674 [Venustampulla echinocandica]RDL36322.1 hypothetical protein BP5553_05674 [Venustampulla echinocandica]
MKVVNVFCFLLAFLLTNALNAASSSTNTELAILMPTAPPTTTTRDPWECATENITNYFDVPTATGALDTALISYGRSLFQTCTLTGLDRTACRNPDSSAWCAFDTVAPSTLLSAYSSYASLASSWWSNHKSGALSLASNCPQNWYRTGSQNLFGFGSLNDTINVVGCYASAHPTSGSATATPTGPIATPGSKVTMSGPAPTSTKGANSAFGRAGNIDIWMVAGSGIAVVAAN